MLTEEQKKERGWYYVGHDKYYWRNCDNCGVEYRGMGSNFCSRKCSANLTLFKEDDGTVSIGLKKRSTGHNYSDAISKGKLGKPNINLQGSKHHNWRGGVSQINKTERRNIMLRAEYKEWRRRVYERDGFECVVCGSKQIEAHHIYRWSKYPELRYEINNGVSVCKAHHPRKLEEELSMVELFKKLIDKKLCHSRGI